MSNGEKLDGEEGDWAVPNDFPRERITGALPGAQPKFLATLYKGRYYMAGCTPPEIYDRWCVCEDLVAQLSTRSVKSKEGKRSHMTESEILHQYYTRLLATKWTSIQETQWIIQKVADRIGWDVGGEAWTDKQ